MNELIDLFGFLIGLITMGFLWYWADYHEKTSAYHRGFKAGRKNASPIWIPASEKLPKEDGRYIVTAEYAHVDGYDDFETEYAEYANGKWDVVSLHCGTIENIVAWMPLPAPWKENGGIHSGLYER